MVKLPDLVQRQQRRDEVHADLGIGVFRNLVLGHRSTSHLFMHSYTLEGAIYRRDFLSDLIEQTAFRTQFDRILSRLPEREIHHIKTYGDGHELSFEAIKGQLRELEKWAKLPKTIEMMAELPGATEGTRDLRAFGGRARRSLHDFASIGEKLSTHIRERIDYPGMHEGFNNDESFDDEEIDMHWAEDCIRTVSPFYSRLSDIAEIRLQLNHYRTLCKPYEWKFNGKRIPSCKPTFLDPNERRGTIKNAHHPVYFRHQEISEPGKRTKTIIAALDVPNDIHWGCDARNTFIQGPNSMGKSVYMNNIALNIHLAMTGARCFADSAELSPVNKIFPCFDMGASMNEGHFGTGGYKVKYMLDNVTRKDIVLLDEAGSGTEPEAERTIAKGICDALIKTGITTFTITHDKTAWVHHRRDQGVALLRVANIDDKNRKYKVWPGIAKGGYGMQKARELGIDPSSAYENLRRRLE